MDVIDLTLSSNEEKMLTVKHAKLLPPGHSQTVELDQPLVEEPSSPGTQVIISFSHFWSLKAQEWWIFQFMARNLSMACYLA